MYGPFSDNHEFNVGLCRTFSQPCHLFLTQPCTRTLGHLVSVEPVEERDADDGGANAGAVREGGEGLRLHLDVLDAGGVQLAQVGRLVVGRVVAEGAVEAALALVKVVGAQRLAAGDGKAAAHALAQLHQVHRQILVQLCRVPHPLSQHDLRFKKSPMLQLTTPERNFVGNRLIYLLEVWVEFPVEHLLSNDHGPALEADAAAGPDAEKYWVFDSGVCQQFDHLVEKDRDGGNAHTMGDGEDRPHLEHAVPAQRKSSH